VWISIGYHVRCVGEYDICSESDVFTTSLRLLVSRASCNTEGTAPYKKSPQASSTRSPGRCLKTAPQSTRPTMPLARFVEDAALSLLGITLKEEQSREFHHCLILPPVSLRRTPTGRWKLRIRSIQARPVQLLRTC